MSSKDIFEQSSHLFGSNAIFVEELYERFLHNPDSVDASWREFFSALGDSVNVISAENRGAPWAPRSKAVIGQADEDERPAKNGKDTVVLGKEVVEATSRDSVRARKLIHAFRHRGSLIADLDPLKQVANQYHADLDPASYGFTEEDYDHPIFLDGELGMDSATLREILSMLHKTYCSKIGAEFMHIQHPEQRAWIQERMEHAAGEFGLSTDAKKRIHRDLCEVEGFEHFVHVKYPGTKRFSIEGGEAMIPGMETAILTASDLGVEEVVIGMPHRGRLNVLTTVMGKPYLELFSLFMGKMDFPEWVDSSGDVKYHLGISNDRELPNGKTVHLSLTANPSHLEAVNPVVVGKVRAKQAQKGDVEKSRVLGIQLHGDAAFAGQGVVAESLSLSELRGYRTGGTLHIIVNNQIGFTTSPKYSRFTPYPSDVAKMVQAPIFHVNGDDPEAVSYVCKLAIEFRQTFKRDVVVDIFCYRKYGHNESDEPFFTQPQMYTEISKHLSPATIYSNTLMEKGVMSQQEVDHTVSDLQAFFEREYEAAEAFVPNKADWLEGIWSGMEKPKGVHPHGDTGVKLETLKDIGLSISQEPEGYEINRKILRQLKAKREMMESGEGIDWATGEALAMGSLLIEGKPVRLSGQDSCRGTFSHRHSVLVDQKTEARYTPLNNLREGQKYLEVLDSSLSEFAVLGFEYGYSTADPSALVMWEAQFGDFANGAQVMIDQFIASGEEKWLRMSGLVMLLPHGYEGQGPEHSSARLERFLQLCGEDNMQVINCTTPAQYFHVLRRQLHRKFRKPLIVMSPKSLLRHKLAISSLKEFGPGTHFQRVLPEHDSKIKPEKVRRIVFCCGKVYYDLLEYREAQKITDVALIRTEQLYPFPADEIRAELQRYEKAGVYWCQEEPENMGAWRFIGPRIGDVLDNLGREHVRIRYAGREEAASPATGYLKIHNREQEALIQQAFAK